MQIEGIEAREIPGLGGRYAATVDGRIFSLIHRAPLERVVTPNIHGYPLISIKVEGKTRTFSVHRLIAEAFHGPPPFPRAVVRHIDSNKRNNAAANLAWATQSENLADRELRGTIPRGEKNTKAKLTDEAVAEILRIASPRRRNMSALARKFGVSVSAVWLVVNGRSWRHIQRAPQQDGVA